MANIYYDYKIDNDDYILSWQSWNPERDKENVTYQTFIDSIKNNPEPLPQMQDVIKDEDGRLYLMSTNKNFKLINNNIEIVSHIKTDNEKFKDKYSIIEICKKIVKGIENKSNSDYLEFLSDLNKTTKRE